MPDLRRASANPGVALLDSLELAGPRDAQHRTDRPREVERTREHVRAHQVRIVDIAPGDHGEDERGGRDDQPESGPTLRLG